MLSKIKNYWKDNIFFSLVALKKESNFNIINVLFWLMCFGILYTKLSYFILLNYFIAVILDVEKTNKKFYRIFNIVSGCLFISFLIYLLVIL